MIPQEHSPSDLTSLHTYKYREETITRIKKEQITPSNSGTTELLRSDLEPMHNYLAILQTFESNLF